ncbi:unnamed protein product (macronuclear) [Paramecium tetraurelia]|uniref:Uncharacterized protein n=1 Tax=Paramecium tetraurelia TaxID=5888 RepID=A0BEG7_PARTE|nr:uncharacterized protein GSPATT00027967001 [Paramecium tetraurelia]CAK56934.1 unnamed protein product [Paramecium tetraurelia]|eukprot:XP_001424332.1 hypothetical protein (macronuclear) [Paramecium tetraurelia strain d4-2]
MPITNDLFQELLVFEDRYSQGSDKYDVIQKLVDLYAVLIEHYDSIQDPVGYYFNEKLQSLFACQRALKTIRKINQDQGTFAPSHTQSLIVQEARSIENSQESAKAKQVVGVEQKKRERQTKAKIAMEIQDQIDYSQNNLEHLITGYQQTSDQNQKVIEEDLKRQDDNFLQRRQKREKTNLMRRSSRMCSTKCSTERLDVFDSCIEFSNGAQEQVRESNNNNRLMQFLKEQSDKVSTDKHQSQESAQVEDVQPFEDLKVEETDDISNIIPPRRQIRESASEDIMDTPPQQFRKPKQFGMIDNDGDLLVLEDEQNLISDLNIEINSKQIGN